jgi:hypothetical protein
MDLAENAAMDSDIRKPLVWVRLFDITLRCDRQLFLVFIHHAFPP